MGNIVKQRAEAVGTFRWINVRLMEMLAGWVPTTPEMEVKVLFGRHVWDCAQHADALGKRAYELRAPLQFSLPPSDAYRAFLGELLELTTTADRIGSFYDVISPSLVERYRTYIGTTDSLMDEPSVRILDNMVRDHERMAAERVRLVPDSLAGHGMAGIDEWRKRERLLDLPTAPSLRRADQGRAGA